MEEYTVKNLMQEFESKEAQLKMTQEKLDALLRQCAKVSILEEQAGYVLFTYNERKMMLLSDDNYNRMRIIAPITSYSSLAPKIKDALMDANFHSALDARYAVSEDTLYAAFLHPLASLVDEDFESALLQVYNLVQNFSKTYSSAQIEFTKKK